MDTLIWIGAAISLLGLIGLVWSIIKVARAKRASLTDEELRKAVQAVMPLNLGAQRFDAHTVADHRLQPGFRRPEGPVGMVDGLHRADHPKEPVQFRRLHRAAAPTRKLVPQHHHDIDIRCPRDNAAIH